MHAERLGVHDPAGLSIRTLRSWLANLQTLGRARTTIARRATSARVFTLWLARTGRAPADAGALLASPKAHRELPVALSEVEVRALLDATVQSLADDGPRGLRDLAILEVLYATGIRVGELVGLDIDDLDRGRRVVRVFGKGRKERSVPYGLPASEAIELWLERGRPAIATDSSGAAVFLGTRGSRIDQRAVRRIVHERLAAVDGAPDLGPARAAAHRRDPSARGRRGPAQRAGDPRSRLARHDADLHPRQQRTSESRLQARPPQGLAPRACAVWLLHEGADVTTLRRSRRFATGTPGGSRGGRTSGP